MTKTTDPSQPSIARILTLAGWGLLVVWGMWWAVSMQQLRLERGERTWVPAWGFLGLDFAHNYLAVHKWMDGGNPYLDDIGDPRGRYAYPPIGMLPFLWCAPFSFEVSTRIWTIVVAGIMGFAAWRCYVFRNVERLTWIPLHFLIAAILWSFPVFFAMERGNSDAIVVLAIVIAGIAATRAKTIRYDTLIGTCLAIAAWVKIYPLILIGGLLVLRRYRAGYLGIAAALLIGIATWPWMDDWMNASRQAQEARLGIMGEALSWLRGESSEIRTMQTFAPIEYCSHSIPSYWRQFWAQMKVPLLASLPGLIGAALILVPLAGAVSYSVYRRNDGERLFYPYLLWLAALATFGMPVSYDYNLIYLPLVVTAVWDRRLGWPLHAVLIPLVIWWQPFATDLVGHPRMLLAFKLSALVATGLALVLWKQRDWPDTKVSPSMCSHAFDAGKAEAHLQSDKT